MIFFTFIMYTDFVEWLEKNQMTCYYKKYYGISCLGCGFQTAVLQLLNGNIIDSIKSYPALIPIIFTVIFFVIYLKKNTSTIVKIIKYLILTDLILMFANWIKNLVVLYL